MCCGIQAAALTQAALCHVLWYTGGGANSGNTLSWAVVYQHSAMCSGIQAAALAQAALLYLAHVGALATSQMTVSEQLLMQLASDTHYVGIGGT